MPRPPLEWANATAGGMVCSNCGIPAKHLDDAGGGRHWMHTCTCGVDPYEAPVGPQPTITNITVNGMPLTEWLKQFEPGAQPLPTEHHYYVDTPFLCPKCHGEKVLSLYGDTCRICNGTGLVWASQSPANQPPQGFSEGSSES